ILNIDLAVGRIFFSLLLIIFGIMLMTGSYRHQSNNTAVFSESKFMFNKENDEYSVVFGQGTLDLRDLELTGELNVKASCVFGELKVYLKPDMNYIIYSSTAFGSVNIPQGRPNSGFGSSEVKSAGYDSNAPKLILRADAVFGAVDIIH
ncbi:MAG: hypothetical protein ACOC31_05635, partial [Bacteroidota bacterium]